MQKLQMHQKRGEGFLFTFCGLDGCGKTTIINRLIKDLEQEYSLLVTKQPTDLVRQSAIFRTYMDDPNHQSYDYRSLSLLAASDRVQHTNKVIEPAIDEKKIVISDRYFYSCLANLRARGFEKDQWIYEISQTIVQPDIAFFLDVPVEVAIERVRSRPAEKERYIDMNLQFGLRNEYINICRLNNGILLSTTQDVDTTYKIVYQLIKRKLEESI